MADDPYGPPPGASEEELRRWKQWRKFTWLPQDVVITKRGDGKEPREGEEARDAEPQDPGGRGR